MKAHPIIMSTASILGMQRGTKIETRRPLYSEAGRPNRNHSIQVGDRLWVREPIKWVDETPYYEADSRLLTAHQAYGLTEDRADKDGITQAMFAPKPTSRYVLVITEVRHENLQDITEEGAQDEGYASLSDFVLAWDDLHSDYLKWDMNPEVVAIRFGVIEANIEDL